MHIYSYYDAVDVKTFEVNISNASLSGQDFPFRVVQYTPLTVL